MFIVNQKGDKCVKIESVSSKLEYYKITEKELDKVFEAFEEIGVNVLKDEDDLLEPDIDDLNEVEEINEILKSDQPAVDRFIKSKDPKFLEKLGEEIDNLWTL